MNAGFPVLLHWLPNIFKNAWRITDNICGGHYSFNKNHSIVDGVLIHIVFLGSLEKEIHEVDKPGYLAGQLIGPPLPIIQAQSIQFW